MGKIKLKTHKGTKKSLTKRNSGSVSFILSVWRRDEFEIVSDCARKAGLGIQYLYVTYGLFGSSSDSKKLKNLLDRMN